MERLNKMVLKEFQQTNLQSFSDGQITIVFPLEEDLTHVEVVLTPTGGLYKGGRYSFRVTLPHDYPMSVAGITCMTKIFHPNINYDGYICFNILSDEWNSGVRLVDYAHALLWLLYQPNLDSRLNGDCPGDKTSFSDLVKLSMAGKVVAGQTFPKFVELKPVEEVLAGPVVQDLVRQLNAPTQVQLNLQAHRFLRPTANAPASPTPNPRRAPPRAWPSVSSGVRFVNGVRSY